MTTFTNWSPEDPIDHHDNCETCGIKTPAGVTLCDSCASFEDISESVVDCDWCYGQGIEGVDVCPQCGERRKSD